MNDSIIARRYAKAIFSLGLEQKKLEIYTDNFKSLEQIVRQDENFQFLLDNPVVANSKKKAIFKKLFDGKLDKDVLQFLYLLVDKGREDYILDIIRAYIQIYREHANIQKVEIKSAIPLEQSVIDEISSIMEKMTGKTSETETNTEEKLIGGFVLRVGDQQLDASVSGKLKSIKKQLTSKH